MASIDQSISKLSIGGDVKNSVCFAEKKYGKAGKSVNLKTNFFKITINPQSSPNFYHYNVEIIPEGWSIRPSGASTDVKSTGSPTGIQSTSSTNVQSTGGNSKAPPKAKPARPGRKAAAAAKSGLPTSSNAPASNKATSSNTSPLIVSSIPFSSAESSSKAKKTPKKIHDEIFSQVFKQHPVFKCDILPIFDGEKNFYSLTKFNLANNQWTGLVSIINGDLEEKYRVNFTTPEFSHLQSFNNLLKSTELMPVALQALDILLKNGPKRSKLAIGANLFPKSTDPAFQSSKFDIDLVKNGVFGYYQATKITENGLQLNVDRAMAVFTKGMKLKSLWDEVKGNLQRFKELVIGQRITVIHLNFNRSFLVSGLTKETIQNVKFKNQETNTDISVLQYFKNKYKGFCERVRLDQNLNCIIVGVQKKNYYPIEACELLPDELYRQRLKPILQSNVTRESSQQQPFDRFEAILRNSSTIQADNTIGSVDYLKKFGVSVDTKEHETLNARVIDAPKLDYGNGEVNTGGRGEWKIDGLEFYNPSRIDEDWAIVNFHSFGNRERFRSSKTSDVNKVIKLYISNARNRGIQMGELSTPRRTIYEYHYRGKNTIEKDLFQVLPKSLKLLIILIPNIDEIYNEIKYVAELKLGLITQVMNQEKPYWRNLNDNLINNLLLKINPKLGGVNHKISSKCTPAILKDKKTMIIGLDVTHPNSADGLNKSIAAVVASYTDEFDKVYHQIKVQEPNKEMVEIKNVMKNLLQFYFGKNGFYPEKIMVYRDGVGEGFFQRVIDSELSNMKKACAELGEEKIKFTYIMVQKRHNARFLPANAKKGAKFQNVEPGTIVDRGITNKNFYEFYLCSHKGMLGTSRPGKYVVLVDENDLSADDLQKATYFLSYLFPRCTKAISMPVFVFYAHLLAKRARSYMAHMNDSDAKSSSSGKKEAILSKDQFQKLNEKVQVKVDLNGILFFI